MADTTAFPVKRWLVNAPVVAFGASAVVVRLLAPNRLMRGLSRARWAAVLGAAASGIKLLETCVLVVRREVPAGRILLPGLVFLELIRISIGQTTRTRLIAVLVIFELCLIAFAIAQLCRVHRSGRFLEEHFEQVFQQFLPDRLSAMASREVVLLWEGLRWMARGFRNEPVAGFSYVHESVVRYLPVIIPLVSVGDEVVLGIMLRNQALWIRLAVIGIDVWAIFFAFGLFATFYGRPHRVDSESVRLQCGVFSTCEFHPGLLLDAARLDDVERSKRTKMGNLTVKGTPTVKITLRQGVLVRHSFRRQQIFDTLLVSADKPEELCHALKRVAAPSTRQG